MPETLECNVCGCDHDEDIHEATLSVHRWFHDQVTQFLWDEDYDMIPYEIVA